MNFYDTVRDALRARHYAYRTEKTYLHRRVRMRSRRLEMSGILQRMKDEEYIQA